MNSPAIGSNWMSRICKPDDKWKGFSKYYEKNAGIVQIIKRENCLIPLMYIVYLLVGVILTLYQLTTLGSNYFQYPITSAFTEASANITIPDIRICDLYPPAHDYYNPIKLSEFYEMVSNFSVGSLIPKTYTTFLLTTFPWIESYNATKEFENCFLNNPFVLFCDYTHILDGGTHDCAGDIDMSWDPLYKCQTLRLSGKARANGTIRGISMYVYLDNFLTDGSPNSWEPRQMYANGVQVALSAPGTKPSLRSKNLISAGTASIVRISQTNRVRLSKPYNDRDCTNQQYLPGSDTERYTYDGCFSVCLQDIVITNCNCISPYYHFTKGQLKSANYIFCGNFSADNLDDFNKRQNMSKCGEKHQTYTNFENDCENECLMPCNEIIYSTSISAVSWPHVADYRNMYDIMTGCTAVFGGNFDIYENNGPNDSLNQLNDSDISYKISDGHQLNNMNLIKNNFLQISFIIDDERPIRWEDVKQFTWDTTLGQIGGILGLWLGLTAMSIVTIVELVYTFVMFRNSSGHKIQPNTIC